MGYDRPETEFLDELKALENDLTGWNRFAGTSGHRRKKYRPAFENGQLFRNWDDCPYGTVLNDDGEPELD